MMTSTKFPNKSPASGSSAGNTVGTAGILGEAPKTSPELPPSVISPALARSAESGTVSPLLLSLAGSGMLADGGSSAPPGANVSLDILGIESGFGASYRTAVYYEDCNSDYTGIH